MMYGMREPRGNVKVHHVFGGAVAVVAPAVVPVAVDSEKRDSSPDDAAPISATAADAVTAPPSEMLHHNSVFVMR